MVKLITFVHKFYRTNPDIYYCILQKIHYNFEIRYIF